MITSSFLVSFYFVCGVIIIFLAVTILRYSQKNVVSWATALVLTFAGFGPILSAVGIMLEQNREQGTVLFHNLSISFNYVWEFFFPSLLFFALVYPRRHRLWKFVSKLVWFFYLPHMFHLLLMIFFPDWGAPSWAAHVAARMNFSSGVLSSMALKAASMVDVFVGLFFKAHMKLFSVVNIFYAAMAIALLAASLRLDLAPRVKRQVKVVLIGLGLCVFTYSWAKFIPILAGLNFKESTSMLFINASLILGGSSIGYAVVRLQFLGVRAIARKGIVYATAAALSASVYLLTVRQITRFVYDFSSSGAEILDTGMIILFIIIFQPILSRIEEWSELVLVRGGKSQRMRIKELMTELLSVIDVEDLRREVVSVVSDAFSADRVELWIKGDIDFDESEYGRTVTGTLARIAEPIKREDLLEAVHYDGSTLELRQKKVNSLELSNHSAFLSKLYNYNMVVPVVDREECVALLLIGYDDGRGKFSAEELELLSMLASQIASSLNNISLLKEVFEKKLMEEELSIARAIQLNLLPSRPPELERYELAAMSRSSKYVGGDYYDFIFREGMLAIAVADVSGKGVPASLLMASLQASLRGAMSVMDKPVEVVKRLNEAMFDTTSTDRFATMFYGCLETDSDTLKYTNAGHLFPVVVRDGGGIEVLDYSGLIIGVKPDFEYREEQVKLDRGDIFVVVTDGVTEAENRSGDFFGEERLYMLLSTLRDLSADEIKERIVSYVMDFCGTDAATDDITVLVLKRVE